MKNKRIASGEISEDEIHDEKTEDYGSAEHDGIQEVDEEKREPPLYIKITTEVSIDTTDFCISIFSISLSFSHFLQIYPPLFKFIITWNPPPHQGGTLPFYQKMYHVCVIIIGIVS